MPALENLEELQYLSQEDKEAVLRQTERLVSSIHFRNSRRYTDLLRFVVEKTLAGQSEILKERTLGVEVFQREPTFNTAGDSIVRVAAAEVRKRIAQYYQEEGRERELRIDLPSGSYVAHFLRPHPPTPNPSPVMEAVQPAAPAEPPFAEKSRSSIRARFTWASCLLIVAASVILLNGWLIGLPVRNAGILQSFWKNPHDAVVCIGVPLQVTAPGNDNAAAAALGQPAANNTVIPFGDALTLSLVQSLLAERHKANRVQLSRLTTFNDLRTGPVVLIGAFDNSWTMMLTAKLRFRLAGSDGTQGYIVDSRSKDVNWSVDFHVPYSDRTQDYAIVAITHDDTLDQPLIVVAGIGPNGTVAAGEFLMNKANLEAVSRLAPHGWGGKNVEIVLATQVIQGNAGPPRVVASEYW